MEDRELKERLLLALERLRDVEPEIVKAALELLRKELREATSSMTSVPKPMKFLGPHYAVLKTVHAGLPAGDNKRACAQARPAFVGRAAVALKAMPRTHDAAPLDARTCPQCCSPTSCRASQ